MRRAIRPRPPVTVGAAMVSQLTSLPLLGIDARRYLDHVVPLCGEAVVRLGKLRLVPVDVAVTVLQGLAAPQDAATEPDGPNDDEQPRSIDDVLARVGLERKS
jgi:hypothetical protein